VLWVHASNAARFEQSYRDIADRFKIPERKDPRADIFKLVYDWLCSTKDRWLLVLDNVDDARFLVDVPVAQRDEAANSRSAPKPLRSYIPYSERGSVLVTTRNRDAALKLVEKGCMISVKPMNKVEASALFRKKLKEDEDCVGIDELTAALEYMPLAIVQAAAYIARKAPRCSVQQYLADFQRSDRQRTTLLDSEAGQLRRDYEAKNSIIITWQISFDYIRETRPSAAGLLSLMSFFDRQGIPEELFRAQPGEEPAQQEQDERGSERQAWEDEDSTSQSSAGDDGFEGDVQTLRDYSFISANTDRASFKMHGLVQLATREWLRVHYELEQWKQRFISNLCAAFPMGNYENWAVCKGLFVHAKSAAEQRPEREDSLREWASLLYKAAWYALRTGSWVEAEAMSLQSVKTRKKILGPEHEETLWSMAIVGEAYRIKGRWKEAEALFVQVMEIRKTKLGADHPYTLTSMANLASTYRNQGRWDEAEALEVQVIETRKTKLGADHPDTLTSMANLASTYRNQGRWDEAEALDVQVMETSKTKLGADHPNTLISMNNLASTYWNQGRWDEAEALDVQVMETSKTKLGADHLDTLNSMANLGVTYSVQGKEDKAELLKMQVMETCKTKLGADHPLTLTNMANLASTYRNQDRWDEAEALEVQVMETRKTKLGVDHPNTLISMNNLAFTLKAQGFTSRAISLMEDCCRVGSVVFGPQHPDFLSFCESLAAWQLEAMDLGEQSNA
jgi:predicted component of type VI protein secretion system/UDP-2,3-diacylglucosamine pyrophosphatase LpxH